MDAFTSGFFQKTGLEHVAHVVDLAVDLMISISKANIFSLRSFFQGNRTSLHLEVLDQKDRVAFLKGRSIRIPDHTIRCPGVSRGVALAPLMKTVRANPLLTIGLGICHAACRTFR